MRGMNQLTVIGAITRTPDLRYTPSGTAVLDYTVSGERQELRQGELKTVPFYLPITSLGKAAEALAERLVAGLPVLVVGNLVQERWETAEGKRARVLGKALRVEELAGEFGRVEDAGGGVRLQGGSALVALGGNLTRDPELRYTPAGEAVMDLSLAVNEKWTDGHGQAQEKVHYFEVVLWREAAEAFVKQEPKKGQPVYVEGMPQSSTWTDRDGNKRKDTKITATSVILLKGGERTGGERASSRPAPAAQPPRQPVAAASGGAQRAPARSGGLDIDQGNDFPPNEEDLPF
ncbi:single-stranded DNA-binding protein [Deinococcus sp. HMF7604]|uniref:single-stranded DNA-binding protein n=1 Tax=Deinococcus betulae TaxID=2873312 RepID=UPI001CCCF268|nr:single-stranded DNA-binding protein [Deinococcus betulae]MBZ9751809.1 single-stranded DNA-binding protein [Deinococcus betulae]